jgi:site-specific DNA-methyltransferase (adenine-specific)
MEERIKLMLGDNMQSLKELPDNSVDSIVTDPPYALTSIKKRFGKEGSAPAQYGSDGAFQRASKGFMGKEWDAEVPTVEFWSEVYRVLKPGGHVLSFGGTRTYHRMAVNIEDAGFEIRDQIMWLYGSGFPKSHNIGKAIDKIQGNKREVLGTKADFSLDGAKRNPNNHREVGAAAKEISHEYGYKQGWEAPVTKGNSDWEGWGTAIKPAVEPICLARKPLSEKSVAENVLKWGTGGLNIDASRIGSETITTNGYGDKGFVAQDGYEPSTHEGRFPANVILECICDDVIRGKKGEPFLYKGKVYNNKELEGDRSVDFMKGSKAEAPNNYNDKGDIHTNPMCPCYILNQQSGVSKSVGPVEYDFDDAPNQNNQTKLTKNIKSGVHYSDTGGASRFFYVPKVSKKERDRGLTGDEKSTRKWNGGMKLTGSGNERKEVGKNTHPTVKPINLLTYLIRLVTPKNGVVMDCFMGSGSTGIAAQLEGFKFIGMEMDEDYFNIAETRINAYEEYRELLK